MNECELCEAYGQLRYDGGIVLMLCAECFEDLNPQGVEYDTLNEYYGVN